MAGPQYYKVSVQSFAHEIRTDLSSLIERYPNGIYVNHLHEEYGESTTRILRAISILQEKGVLEIHQAANNSHYVLPKGYIPPSQFAGLTDLQRRLLEFIVNTTNAQNSDNLRTNYSQLSRVMSCSGGGIRTSLHRLEHLGYLETISNAAQGHQDALLLHVTTKAKPPP